MLRYKHVSIAGENALQTLEAALIGTEGVVKHVVGVYAHEVTAALNYDARIEAWIEQEQIADVDIRQFQNGAAATPLLTEPVFIPLDIALPVGKTLSIGHTSGATASDMVYTVVYKLGTA